MNNFKRFDDIEGLELIAYNKEFSDYYSQEEENSGQIKNDVIKLLYMLYIMMDKNTGFIEQKIIEIEPDIIIADPFVIGAKAICKKIKKPLILFYSLLLPDPTGPVIPAEAKKSMLLHPVRFMKTIALQKKMEKKWGYCDLPDKLLSHDGRMCIVSTIKEFQPGGEEFPPNVIFAGPPNVEIIENPKKEKLIFVSMGTVESSISTIRICLSVAKGSEYEFIITLAGNKQNCISEKIELKNVTIFDNLTQVEFRSYLTRAVVFINSGGTNSIWDSIMTKTPILVYTKSPESKNTGRLVELYKCGILHSGDQTKQIMYDEIVKLITDKIYVQGLEKFQNKFKESNGYESVAEIIIESKGEYNE